MLIAGSMDTHFKTTHKEIRRYWTLAFSIPLLLALIIAVFIIAQRPRYKGIIIIAAILIYAVFILRSILWELWGREVIVIDDKKLVIKKQGSFFTPEKIYTLKLIKNIKIEPVKLSFMNFIVQKGPFINIVPRGPITFEYNGQKTNFGGVIGLDAAKKLKTLLEENSKLHSV